MNLRENVKIDGLPFTWRTNLSNDGIRDFYSLHSERICKSDPPNDPMSKTFVIPLRMGFLEFQDGFCVWVATGENHAVLYRTNREWELWDARQKEIQELRREQAIELQVEQTLLETEDDHLREKTDAAFKAGDYQAAAAYVTARAEFRLTFKQVMEGSPPFRWRQSFSAWWSFTQFPNSRYGIEFLRKNGGNPQLFAQFAHWFAARCGLERDECAEQAKQIYDEAMRLFPDSASLAKAACLFWR